MADHHVDRPEVKAEQSAFEPTGTNRPIGLISYRHTHRALHIPAIASIAGPIPPAIASIAGPFERSPAGNRRRTKLPALRRPGGHSGGKSTRSHPELGRENPQRPWYCVSRRGRVGRRQVFQGQVFQARVFQARVSAPSRRPSARGRKIPPNADSRRPRHIARNTPSLENRYRGVEQPGSSSGS